MKPEDFHDLCDKFRSPFMEENKDRWELRSSVNSED